MLDRKIKDVDASIEILENRKKYAKTVFFIFFIIGWILTIVSMTFLPYSLGDIGIGGGICFLIFATWFCMDMNYYNTLIMIKKLDKQEK